MKLQSPKQEQNSKRPMSSNQRNEEISIPETHQNWPNSQPNHRRVKLQWATALEKSTTEPRKEPGAGRDPPQTPQTSPTRKNRSSMKNKVEIHDKQVRCNIALPKAARARISWYLPSDKGNASGLASSSTPARRAGEGQGRHLLCRRGISPGGLADLETGATEQHKVQNAEHKDYARMSALTWKNTQRNI